MLQSITRKLRRRPESKRRAPHLDLGEKGERLAVEYLEEFESYRVVATNVLVLLGRGFKGSRMAAEIDVVAFDGDTLAFVEVKTRTSERIAAADRAVDLGKLRRIARAAWQYRRLMNLTHHPYRYDVVAVVEGDSGFRPELIRGYFDDSVFHRGRYFSAV